MAKSSLVTFLNKALRQKKTKPTYKKKWSPRYSKSTASTARKICKKIARVRYTTRIQNLPKLFSVVPTRGNVVFQYSPGNDVFYTKTWKNTFAAKMRGLKALARTNAQSQIQGFFVYPGGKTSPTFAVEEPINPAVVSRNIAQPPQIA